MKVLIIGPSISRTKGGMATVINDMLQNGNPKVEYRHIVSHVEGNAAEKVVYNLKAIGLFLKERNVDIVHIHVASGASFYRKSLFVRLSNVLKIPVVIHVHGADFDSFYNNASPIAKPYIKKIFSLCSKVLVLSQFWKDFFVNYISSNNVEVLHNGVYTEVFASCYTMPENLNRFLFLGRLGQRKGVYDLLEAIDRLVNKEQRQDLMFYLAGDGDIEQVEKIVEDKKLQNNVEILGWVGEKEKLACLKRADTMILPSYNEGLPMSILEAMAAGKIIISGRVGGIPDLVTDKENGFLITPGDVDTLCQYIVFVVTHPGQMVRMAANNRNKIEGHYNLNKINNHLFAIYENVITSKN